MKVGMEMGAGRSQSRGSYRENADRLPFLGVGFSSSVGQRPDPRSLLAAVDGPQFFEYAGPVQVGALGKLPEELRGVGIPMLYHPSCLNLAGPWANPESWLDAVSHHVEAIRSPWLAQDVAICFLSEEGGYSIQLGWFLPPIFSRDGLELAVARVREVRARVHRPLLLEPPPISFRAGEMHPFDWISELAQRTDCGLLLDAGHLFSIQLALGEEAVAFERLDWERVVELHLAGGAIEEEGGLYVDAHELPILPEVWAIGRGVLSRSPRLRAVCVECEGSPEEPARVAIERARQEVLLHAASEGLRARVRAGRGDFVAPSVERAEKPLVRADPKAESGPPAWVAAAAARNLRQHKALLAACLDPEIQDNLGESAMAAWEVLLPQAEDRAPFVGVSAAGLRLDGRYRRQYLMAALCRSWPLSTGALAALFGAGALVAFLASPKMTAEPAVRNLAFGDHLQRLVDGVSLREPAKGLIESLLALERGLIEGAAEVRQEVQAGRVVPDVRAPGRAPDDRERPLLPPFFRAFVLPQPPALIRVALRLPDDPNAWEAISGGLPDKGRLRALARGIPCPTTLLARAHVESIVPSPVPQIAPLIEVGHRVAEVRGHLGSLLAQVDGEHRFEDFSPRNRGILESLLKAGLLALG
jgi:uncharacterized protein (UPF0276 family)